MLGIIICTILVFLSTGELYVEWTAHGQVPCGATSFNVAANLSWLVGDSAVLTIRKSDGNVSGQTNYDSVSFGHALEFSLNYSTGEHFGSLINVFDGSACGLSQELAIKMIEHGGGIFMTSTLFAYATGEYPNKKNVLLLSTQANSRGQCQDLFSGTVPFLFEYSNEGHMNAFTTDDGVSFLLGELGAFGSGSIAVMSVQELDQWSSGVPLLCNISGDEVNHVKDNKLLLSRLSDNTLRCVNVHKNSSCVVSEPVAAQYAYAQGTLGTIASIEREGQDLLVAVISGIWSLLLIDFEDCSLNRQLPIPWDFSTTANGVSASGFLHSPLFPSQLLHFVKCFAMATKMNEKNAVAYFLLNVSDPTGKYEQLPWRGECDIGSVIVCAEDNGIINTWLLHDPTISTGSFQVYGAPQETTVGAPSAPRTNTEAAFIGFVTPEKLPNGKPVPTGHCKGSVVSVEGFLCSGQTYEACMSSTEKCMWNPEASLCTPTDESSGNLTCLDFSANHPNRAKLPQVTCSQLNACAKCSALGDVCVSRKSTTFVGGQCPALCSAIHSEDICSATGMCVWRANFCSASVCFSFLREGFDVMPLVVFFVAVIKASLVLTVWAIFGASVLRRFRSLRHRQWKLVPMVAMDESPMAKPGTEPSRLFPRDWSFHDYLHEMLRLNFDIDPTPEDVDRVAYVLSEAGLMMTLRPAHGQHLESRHKIPYEAVQAILNNMKSPPSGFSPPNWLTIIRVCYVPSLRASRRFTASLDIFPGMFMLSAYFFFAVLLLGLSIYEVSQYSEENLWISYQLVAFRIMNSSLLISVAFLCIKFARRIALRRRYAANSHVMVLSHRAEVQRHKLSKKQRKLFCVYLSVIAPFVLLSIVGFGRFGWVALICFAAAAICSFLLKPLFHATLNRIGRACASFGELHGDELALNSTTLLEQSTWRIVSHDKEESPCDNVSSPSAYGATAGRTGVDINDGIDRDEEECDEIAPSQPTNDEQPGDRYLPEIRSSAFGVAHSFISFLTVDAVWGSAIAIAAQMMFNYALMLINMDTFELQTSQIPATEFSSRSNACLLYLLKKNVRDFSMEISHRVQVLSAALPFF